MTWLGWLQANWTWIVPVAVAIASTVLVKWCEFYGHDNPRLTRAIRFLLSLMAFLPARGAVGKGVRLMVGGLEIAPPLTSWSAPDNTKPKTRAGSVITRVGCVFTVILAGCSWQSTLRGGLDGVSAIATYAPRAIELRCNTAKDTCIADKDRVCKPLQVCTDDLRAASKANVAVQGVVKVGLSAVKVGDKPSAELLLAEALTLIGPVKSVLAAYGVVLP